MSATMRCTHDAIVRQRGINKRKMQQNLGFIQRNGFNY